VKLKLEKALEGRVDQHFFYFNQFYFLGEVFQSLEAFFFALELFVDGSICCWLFIHELIFSTL
jgi:hypothetical protein